jgi:hypothetical protein
VKAERAIEDLAASAVAWQPEDQPPASES